jgi:uncharacterized protein (TIGR00255 family)
VRTHDLIVGLDVGTTKICAVIAEPNALGGLDIIGVGAAPSRGLRKGVVVNIDSTVEAIKQAVAELTSGATVDAQRLALEIALLADRVDITEELVRFRAHVAAARDALASDQAVGKQLGFLAQELLREVNTMGSKANDARITQTVILMKGDLEKFREQLENLE